MRSMSWEGLIQGLAVGIAELRQVWADGAYRELIQHVTQPDDVRVTRRWDVAALAKVQVERKDQFVMNPGRIVRASPPIGRAAAVRLRLVTRLVAVGHQGFPAVRVGGLQTRERSVSFTSLYVQNVKSGAFARPSLRYVTPW